jgi:hypothetical protein
MYKAKKINVFPSIFSFLLLLYSVVSACNYHFPNNVNCPHHFNEKMSFVFNGKPTMWIVDLWNLARSDLLIYWLEI